MPHALRRFAAVSAALACLLLLAPVPVGAHELLPPELVQFLRENPDASQAEFDAYLSSQPELTKGGDAAYRQRLVDTVFGAGPTWWENAWIFIKLGFQHILEGTDHVLFVLALLLTFTALVPTLKSITAFTIAHSITLILAGLDIVTLESRLVESIIALSIAFVAITTVFLRRYKYFSSMDSKVSVIFLFGLFHGMGFAGLLKDFYIPEGQFIPSLLFFNVGIELGQILIILLALPFIYLFRKKSWYPLAMKIIAVGISAMAMVWFFERAFGA